jgi:hypothetical protein
LICPQKIKVNQAKSNQIKVNQAILKHFFMQKSTLLPPLLRLWSDNELAQTNGFGFIVNVGLSNRVKVRQSGSNRYS